jgi:hypothetical protein
MNKGTLRLLVVLAILACADSPTPPDPFSAVVPGSTGNPPPPSLLGDVEGDFSVDVSSTTTSGMSAAASASQAASITHAFAIQPVEFAANQSRTNYFMIFPKQTPPPGGRRLGTLLRGRIALVGGVVSGVGRIFDFDPVNNGFFVIDLAQFNGLGRSPFVPCGQSVQPGCWEIVPPVTATFYQIREQDRNGDYFFRAFQTGPAVLKFVFSVDAQAR